MIRIEPHNIFVKSFADSLARKAMEGRSLSPFEKELALKFGIDIAALAPVSLKEKEFKLAIGRFREICRDGDGVVVSTYLWDVIGLKKSPQGIRLGRFTISSFSFFDPLVAKLFGKGDIYRMVEDSDYGRFHLVITYRLYDMISLRRESADADI